MSNRRILKRTWLPLCLGVALGLLGRLALIDPPDPEQRGATPPGQLISQDTGNEPTPTAPPKDLEAPRTVEDHIERARELANVDLPEPSAQVTAQFIDLEGNPIPDIEVSCAPTGRIWGQPWEVQKHKPPAAERFARSIRAEVLRRAQTQFRQTDANGEVTFDIATDQEVVLGVRNVGWRGHGATLGPGGTATLELTPLDTIQLNLVREDGTVPAEGYVWLTSDGLSSAPPMYQLWTPESRELDCSSHATRITATDGEEFVGFLSWSPEEVDRSRPLTVTLRERGIRFIRVPVTAILTGTEPDAQIGNFALLERPNGETLEECFERLGYGPAWSDLGKPLHVRPGSYWLVARRWRTTFSYGMPDLTECVVHPLEVGTEPITFPVSIPSLDPSRRLRVLVRDPDGRTIRPHHFQLLHSNTDHNGRTRLETLVSLQSDFRSEDGTLWLSKLSNPSNPSPQPERLFLEIGRDRQNHRVPLSSFEGNSIVVDLPPYVVVKIELEGTDRRDYRLEFTPRDPLKSSVSVPLMDDGSGIASLEPGHYLVELSRSGSRAKKISQEISLSTGLRTIRFQVD